MFSRGLLLLLLSCSLCHGRTRCSGRPCRSFRCRVTAKYSSRSSWTRADRGHPRRRSTAASPSSSSTRSICGAARPYGSTARSRRPWWRATVRYDTLTRHLPRARARSTAAPSAPTRPHKEDVAWSSLTRDFARLSLFRGISLEPNAGLLRPRARECVAPQRLLHLALAGRRCGGVREVHFHQVRVHGANSDIVRAALRPSLLLALCLTVTSGAAAVGLHSRREPPCSRHLSRGAAAAGRHSRHVRDRAQATAWPVWEKGFGFQNVATRERATPDTPYLVGDMSGTLAAVLLLQCVEQRRLGLDDPFERTVCRRPNPTPRCADS